MVCELQFNKIFLLKKKRPIKGEGKELKYKIGHLHVKR